MLLEIDSKLLFVSVEKSGIEWIKDYYSKWELNSLTPRISRFETFTVLFPKDSLQRREVIKVSTVRHPFDWLGCCYEKARELKKLSSIFFFEYVQKYLSFYPGVIGNLFLQSLEGANIVIRFEDLPYSLWELEKSLGMDWNGNYIIAPPKSFAWQKYMGGDDQMKALKYQVVEAEKDFCERFCYL